MLKASHHSGQRLSVDLSVESEAWDTLLPDAERWAEHILRETLIGAGAQQLDRCGLSLLLADDATIRDLNLRFRGQDKPTNVLSFPARILPGDDGALLGDIAFALETVSREAEAAGKPFRNHVSHLLVHGILHLLGHVHDDDETEARMTAVEVAVLRTLGIPDPYAEPEAA